MAMPAAGKQVGAQQVQGGSQIVAFRGAHRAVGDAVHHGAHGRWAAGGAHALPGDDADDALVRLGLQHQVERGVPRRRQLEAQGLLDLPAFQVEGLHPGHEDPGFPGVPGQQQAHRILGAAHAAHGVEPRPHPEADVLGAHRALHLRRLEQLHQARAVGPGQGVQPALDQQRVLAGQGHHVRHGAQRHQLEQAVQEGLVPRRRSGRGVEQGLGQLEGHPDAGQVGIGVVAQARMHHRRGRGQALAQGVVVGNDPVQPEGPARLHLRHGAHAAVHGDHQGRPPGRRQFADAVQMQAIAVVEAVRDEEPHVGPELVQHAHQQRRGGDAVDVVVAIDADRLVPGQGLADPRHGGGHPLQQEGIGRPGPGRIQAPGQVTARAGFAHPGQARRGARKAPLPLQPGPGHGSRGHRPAHAPGQCLHEEKLPMAENFW